MPVLAVDDRVGVAGDVAHDRGRAAGGRLGDGHAPALARRGAGEDPGPPVEVDLVVLVDAAREA